MNHNLPRSVRATLPRRLLAGLVAGMFLLSLPGPAPALAGRAKQAKVEEAEADLVWPLPPDLPRIRYLASYRGSADFKKKGRWRRVLLGKETDTGVALHKPYDVATGPDGSIYVTDTGLGAVVVFDVAAREVRHVGDGGRLRLVTPLGIAVDDDGTMFVADADLDQVVRFEPDGQVALALGRAEGLKNPSGLALDRARDRIFVADSHLHQLFLYSRDGAFLGTWGSRGPGDGQFNFPTNVAVDADGDVYVVDTGNFRVQIFSPEGEFLSTFGEAGSGFGQFHRPKGISLDSEGHIYIADAAFNNFQLFNPEGELLMFVGGLGRKPGTFWLPAGVHIDGDDRIYVVDQINARVQVFQYMTEQVARGYVGTARGERAPDAAGRPPGSSR